MVGNRGENQTTRPYWSPGRLEEREEDKEEGGEGGKRQEEKREGKERRKRQGGKRQGARVRRGVREGRENGGKR